MGKKKTTVKFIDKKKAISFHLVAKAAPGYNAALARAEEEEERLELRRELAQQRREDRARAGLEPEPENEQWEEEGDHDEHDDDEEESKQAGGKPDDRLDLLNLAAAAEGIETRAVRQARKAAKEQERLALEGDRSQKFYLQPSFRRGGPTELPADFPQELLYAGGDREDEAYWAHEEEVKQELRRQSRAPALMPHNYDYDKHLRPVTGRGVVLEAKRDKVYDHPEFDPRSLKPKPEPKIAKEAPAASSSSSSSSAAAAPESFSLTADSSSSSSAAPASSSTSAHAGDEDEEQEAPADPVLFASIQRFQRSLLRQGRRVRAPKDFVAALEEEEQGPVAEEEPFEELQDDFVAQAMMGGLADDDDDEDEEGKEGEKEECEDDDDDFEGGLEYEDDEEDEEAYERRNAARQHMRDLYGGGGASSRHYDDDEDEDEFFEDDDEEDEEPALDGKPQSTMERAFRQLLRDEYDDDEIGELDHLAEEDPDALEGLALEAEQVAGELDEYLTQKDKFKSEGGNIIDSVAAPLRDLTIQKIGLQREEAPEEVDAAIQAMLDGEPETEQWDAESILSTYTDTENHPRVLREQPGRRARSRRASSASSSSGLSAAQMSTAQRMALPTFQPPPVPASILRAHAGEHDDDLDELDEDEEGEEGEEGELRQNRGAARATFETPEEKKRRKQAVKQAQREAKERKKQLKTLYIKETAAAMSKQARLNRMQPAGTVKL